MLKQLRRIVQPLADVLPLGAQRFIDRRFRAYAEMGKLKEASVVVVSFPKSGRTWVRALLSYLFQEVYALKTEKLLGYKNYAEQNGDVPVVVFTHDNHTRAVFGDGTMEALYESKKVILVVRDPRDVEVSAFFHFAFRLDERKKRIYSVTATGQEADVFDHLRDRLRSETNTIVFLNRWGSRVAEQGNILVVRYEDLKRDAEGELRRICEFIDVPASGENLQSAVARASFSSMKSKEREGSFDRQDSRFGSRSSESDDAFKVRRGKVGGFRDYLTPDQVEEINALIEQRLSPGFGYRLDEREPAGPPRRAPRRHRCRREGASPPRR